jgi:hypothetical protein
MKVFKSDYKLDSWSDGCDYGWGGCHSDIKRCLARIPSLEFVDWNERTNDNQSFCFRVNKKDLGLVIAKLLGVYFLPIEAYKEVGSKAYFSFDLH